MLEILTKQLTKQSHKTDMGISKRQVYIGLQNLLKIQIKFSKSYNLKKTVKDYPAISKIDTYVIQYLIQFLAAKLRLLQSQYASKYNT